MCCRTVLWWERDGRRRHLDILSRDMADKAWTTLAIFDRGAPAQSLPLVSSTSELSKIK